MSHEILGVAYNSTVILQQLVSTRKYNPIALHATFSPGQIKTEVENKLKQSKNTPVVLAGNLDIARTFLKAFPKQECKMVLCECPPFLNPPYSPTLQWLDCDLQSAGAWQVAKIKPEDFMDLLDTLKSLSKDGKEYLFSVQYIDDEKKKIEALQKFGESIPKYYKDTIAALEPEQNKSPLKVIKESRKTKETLKSLLTGTLETVEEQHRPVLAKLVLDYQITLVSKREYLSKLNHLIEDETIKKDFLTLRKWMDSKNGALLQEAFFDYATNFERRAWQTILDMHKKVVEEDLHILVLNFDVKTTLQVFPDKVLSYQNLPNDKVSPKEPNRPVSGSLEELLNI
jgi:hypothetical protein